MSIDCMARRPNKGAPLALAEKTMRIRSRTAAGSAKPPGEWDTFPQEAAIFASRCPRLQPFSRPCVLTFYGTGRIGVANEVVQPVMTGLDQPPSSIDGVSRPRRSASMVVCP